MAPLDHAAEDDASGRPPSRRDRRRERIVRAAGALFLERGYGDTSLDEVVRRAGGSKSTIYSLFGGKEGLFAAVVENIVGEVVRPLPDVTALSLGLRETLLLLAREHAAFVLSERHAALMRLVAAEARRRPEIGHAYYEIGPARGHAKLEAYLRGQVAAGALHIAHVSDAAAFFYGMLLHKWTLRRLYDVSPPPTAAEIDALSETVVDSFLAGHRA